MNLGLVKDLLFDKLRMAQLLYKGKTVVITGAGGALGRAYALEFARRGANIIVNDIPNTLNDNYRIGGDAANTVVKEIVSLGGKAIANSSDVTNGKEIVQHALDTFGSIHILINNAGILRDKSFHKMTVDDWQDVLKVHLTGTFSLCHAAWPHMQQQNFGRIVTIGSGAGLYGNFGQANYSAAKMGILGLTNTLAIEGKKHNILANCVVPVARSRMTETVLPAQVLDLLSPSDITPIVTYLSHESCTETGGCFEVGGGWYSKVRLQRSQGVKLKNVGEAAASAEDLAKYFPELSKFDSDTVSYPTSPADALKALMLATKVGEVGTVEAVNNQPLSPPLGSSWQTPHATPSTQNEQPKRSGILKSDALFDKLQGLIIGTSDEAVAVASKVRARVQFNITQGSTNRTWMLDMVNAASIQLLEGEPPADWSPYVVLRCSDETFLKLASGKLSPEFAYMLGQLKIEGSMGAARKVKSLLELTAKYL